MAEASHPIWRSGGCAYLFPCLTK